MRALLTTLTASLAIAACGAREPYPERHLDDVRLTVRMDAQVEVDGRLSRSTPPGELIGMAVPAGVRSIRLACSCEMAEGLAGVTDTLTIPFIHEEVAAEDGCRLSYSQDGITWSPRYRWTRTDGTVHFCATAVLSNSTGRAWDVRSMDLLDSDDRPLLAAGDSVHLPQGEREMAWWQAEGELLELTLRFGWPVAGTWNQLLPCLAPEAGTLAGSLDSLPDWPLRTGDTLWLNARDSLDLCLQMEQLERGHAFLLQLTNNSGRTADLRLQHPDTLPRGAVFLEGEPYSPGLTVQPGGTALVNYSIVYPDS